MWPNKRLIVDRAFTASRTCTAGLCLGTPSYAGKFPRHPNLAHFDFEVSEVNKKLVPPLSTLNFTESAQNAVFIAGPELARRI